MWVRDLSLPESARKRIVGNLTRGQVASQKALKKKKYIRQKERKKVAIRVINKSALNKNSLTLLKIF